MKMLKLLFYYYITLTFFWLCQGKRDNSNGKFVSQQKYENLDSYDSDLPTEKIAKNKRPYQKYTRG